MTTLTSNEAPRVTPNQSGDVDVVSVSIVLPEQDERNIALPNGKCTVGSSERCQVRIDSESVRPLHCLFVREGHEVTATRWAPGVLLNGCDFTTSKLQAGDTIEIGEVQITLIVDQKQADPAAVHAGEETKLGADSLGGGARPPASSTAFEAHSPLFVEPTVKAPLENAFSASSSLKDSESRASAAQSDDQLLRLQAANETVRARCRKLVAVLRSMREEAGEFDQRVDVLQARLSAAKQEREQLFSQLSELQDEATVRENQTAQEIDRLIAELTTAYEKASVAENALADAERIAEDQRSELEQELQATARQLANAEEKFSEHDRGMQELQAEIAALRREQEQWEQVKASGELQRTKLSQALADRERSIETLQTELEHFRKAADQADDSRMEQAAALERVETELEQLREEKEQLLTDRSQLQQYQADLEQTLADSEQNLAVFQLELEKFQLSSRQTEQELSEKTAAWGDMQAELTQVLEERDQLKTKRTEYQLREQSWEHELAARDEKIADLTAEIEQLQSSLDETSQGAAQQSSATEKLQSDLQSLAAERDELLNAQAEQIQNLKAWEEAVESRDRRIKELEEEHDGICQVLQSVEKGAFEQVDACNKMQEQLNTLRAERDQFANALPEQQEYAKQLEQALTERDGSISVLSEEVTKLTERQQELEKELDSGLGAKETLQSEKLELTARIEELLASQSASDEVKAAAESDLVSQKQQIDQLQEHLTATQREREELQRQVADGSLSNNAAQSELESLRGRYEQLESEHRAEVERRQQLDAQLAERDQNVELFQVDLKSVQAELDRTSEKLKALESERETLNLQLTGLREELAAQDTGDPSSNDELVSERDELAKELSSVRQQLEALQAELPHSADDDDDSNERVAALAREIAELKQQAEQKEQDTEQIKEELAEAKSQLAAGESEIARLDELNQRAQSDFAKAEQALKLAEQSLMERSSDKVEPPSDVASDMPTDEDPTASDYPFDVSGADFSAEPQASSEEFHDAYADEHQEGIADDYRYEEQPTESDELSSPEASSSVNWEPVSETSEADDDEVSPQSAEAFASASSDLADESEPESATAEELVISEDSNVEPEAVADEVATDFDSNFEGTSSDEDDEIVVSEEVTSIGTPVLDTQEEADEEPVQEFKPTSFIDQYQHLLEDDNLAEVPQAQPEPPQPAPVENRLAAELDSVGASQDDDSDEALQAYMSNMLRRMRGETSSDEAPAPSSHEPEQINQDSNPVKAVTSVLGNVAPQESDEAFEPAEPMDLESLKRSSQKPALPTDLAAMRELANSSARKAIAKHHKKRHLDKALGMFIVCLISIGVGGYMLLTAAATQEFLGGNFIGGLIAVLVGAVGGLKLLKLLLLAIREGSWEKRVPKPAQTPQS